VHLTENEVHDVNPEICILIGGGSTKMGMIEQVDQGGPNSIIVTSTWSNSVPKQALQLIIEGKQSRNSAHLPGRRVQLIQRILVWPSEVEEPSTKSIRTIKLKPQGISKVTEGGGALIGSRHPLHSVIIIIHHHQRGVKLQNQLLVIVTLDGE
jgi:hypothetical protein